MNVQEAKRVVDTGYQANKSYADTIDMIKELALDGEVVEVFEYAELLYKTDTPKPDYNFTEAGNGEAVAAEWKHKIRYVYEWKGWIIYNKGRWAKDTTGEIRRMVIETMRQLYVDTVKIVDTEVRKKAAQWYINSENDKRVTSILNSTIPQPGISITANQLDDEPWLLNVKNGTIDLHTCELRPADLNDLLTQQIPIDYNPDATAEEWDIFLSTIFNNIVEMIDFMQRGIGSSLIGEQLERIFFFLYGLGMNGKSQFMAALRYVLGMYALEGKPEMFMEKKFAGSGPDEGQASLKGIRLLTATEIKRGQSLDVSLIKRMTGGEPIWHELKFQHGYNYQPTHTLFLSGNHQPKIKDTTDSIWDRLVEVPFDARIAKADEIQNYGMKLAEKYGEAILNWCIKGVKAYNERGLKDRPECVQLANEEYRAGQDSLHDFLEACVSKSTENTLCSELYEAYKKFSQEDDTEPIGKRYFNEAMRERGFKDKRGHANKPSWVGVTLIDEKSNQNSFDGYPGYQNSGKFSTETLLRKLCRK